MLPIPYVHFINPKDTRLKSLYNGSVYYGLVDTDATVTYDQVVIKYQDESGQLITVQQPIKLNGSGVPVLPDGTVYDPVVYSADGNKIGDAALSICMKNNRGVNVYESKAIMGDAFQDYVLEQDSNRQKETTGLSEITGASIGLDLFPLIGQGVRSEGVGVWKVPAVPNPSILDAVPTSEKITVNGGTILTLLPWVSDINTHSRDVILMSYYNLPQFLGGEEGLRLAVSTDGKSYKTITSGALPNTLVTTPSIIFNNGAWWLIGDVTSDLGFSLFKSKNLYDWDLVQSNIIPAGLPTFYTIWDVDFVQGATDVYVSFSVNTTNDNDPAVSTFYPYIAIVNDLETASFGNSAAITSPDLNPSSSYIDFTVTYFNGYFIAAVKEERVGSRSLFTLTSSSLGGTWTNRVNVVVSELPIYEAPALAIVGGDLYFYYDRISGSNTSDKSYLYRTTSNAVTWSNEKIIDIDVTNIRHAFTYNTPEGAARNSLTNNVSVFSRKGANQGLSLPDSAIFATGPSITDSVNGLRVDGYSTIKAIGSNIFDGVGKNTGQIIPAGYYKYNTDQIWNGRNATNLIERNAYTIESNRVSEIESNGWLKLTVNLITPFIAIRWTHSCISGKDYTFSMISDRDVSENLQVVDVTTGTTAPGLIKSSFNGAGYHICVTWNAANTGDYRVGLSTNGLSVGDVFRIDNMQSEANEFPTPFVDFGTTRPDSVMLYEADYLDLRGKYVMCKLSNNFDDNNDYVFIGSKKPNGKWTRIRPTGLDFTDIDNMFVFAVFDDNYDLKFGYWSSSNNSGKIETQDFEDPTLPDSTGFIQLGKVGETSTRRCYEYFIVGDFVGSEFDINGETNQQAVSDFSGRPLKISQFEETAPIPLSNVKRRSDGGIANPLATNNSLTTTNTYSPKKDEVLEASAGVGSISVTLSNSNLKNGDAFYLRLASATLTDIVTVINGGDAIMPGGVNYVISMGNLNNDSAVKFITMPDGKILRSL